MPQTAPLRDSIALLTSVTDQELINLTRRAYILSRDEDAAMKAVARAVLQLPQELQQNLDDRRHRYAPKFKSRHPYISLVGKDRAWSLVVSELRDMAAEENPRKRQTPEEEHLWYLTATINAALWHNLFYAVVATGQVLHEQPSYRTLSMYDFVLSMEDCMYDPFGGPRSEKERPDCTKARRQILDDIAKQLPERAKRRKEGGKWKLNWHYAIP